MCLQDGQNPSTKQRENPHKYLLYKPTFGQLTTFLASGYRELPPGGAMLLYLSADGSAGTAKHSDDSKCFEKAYCEPQNLAKQNEAKLCKVQRKGWSLSQLS